ncbi:MAG: DNA-binding response regulator [Verrucomicrobia bacterium]|nr:MAG: DNA-binding response regulator [Verrucomicrobiota bacterium]
MKATQIMKPSVENHRILLVDDHFVVRLGLADLLSTEPGFDVVGEASDGDEALELFLQLKPSITVIDFDLPKTTGPEVVKKIRQHDAHARVLMLTVSTAEESIWRSVEAGVGGYVVKSAPRDEIIQAVREVSCGRDFFPAEIAKKILARRRRPSLSPRENDVLRCLVSGLANKEIADHLGLAEPTVKMHLVSIFEKLGARDRTQAAMLALQRGLIAPNQSI